MPKDRKTPLEAAEDALRAAEAEFARDPTERNDHKVQGARNFLASIREFAAKHRDFNQPPPQD